LPLPQRQPAGGALTWAVGSSEGPRSQSWRLFGSKRDDDIYLGQRWGTGTIKLSLHRSGKWRMAWDGKYAASVGLPDEVDRVLARWDPPADIVPGWKHAVTVLVTRESMAQHQTAERRPGKVAFFPAPDADGALWFLVLLGQPGAELVVRDAAEVGALELPGGGMVGTVVRPGPLTPGTARVVADVRARILATVTAAGARRNTGFSWGRMDDGSVVLIDPGPVEPEGVGSGAGRPGHITYVRRIDRLPAGGEPGPADGPHEVKE
jgi:hypothetical protein